MVRKPDTKSSTKPAVSKARSKTSSALKKSAAALNEGLGIIALALQELKQIKRNKAKMMRAGTNKELELQ